MKGEYDQKRNGRGIMDQFKIIFGDNMKHGFIALLGATLAATPIFAAGTQSTVTPLTPGKPAGVRRAQDEDNTKLYLLAGGIAGIAIGVAASQGASSASSPTATTSSTTTSTST
jgi:hypothetical protein